MAAGKHRVHSARRTRMGTAVAAGAVPLVLSIVGGGTAHAAASFVDRTARQEVGPQTTADTAPMSGTLGMSARSIADPSYPTPIGPVHPPVAVTPVAPIAPPPGRFRFGDVQVDAPGWIPPEQSSEINDVAAQSEAAVATFFDSIGLERSRSERVAAQTVGGAATGAAVGAALSVPLAATSAIVGGAGGLVSGIPFLPIGLVAGPILGAAIGVAVITGPAMAVGAAAGAALGAAGGLTVTGN